MQLFFSVLLELYIIKSQSDRKIGYYSIAYSILQNGQETSRPAKNKSPSMYIIILENLFFSVALPDIFCLHKYSEIAYFLIKQDFLYFILYLSETP